MKDHPLLTQSGFVTVAGLRAGLVERFVLDENNWTTLTMPADDIVVVVCDAGITESHTYAPATINLARQRYYQATKSMRSKVPVHT